MRYTFYILAFSLLAISCTETKILDASVEVIDHSDCDSHISILKLKSNGGQAPYIYQLRRKSDSKIVLTKVSGEQELIVEQPNLNNIFYELEVIDDLLANSEVAFEVEPRGLSTFGDVLQMENDGILYAMDNVAINLFRLEESTELYRTAVTDKEGKYLFEDIPSGIYYISIPINEKYKSFHLTATNSDGHIRLGSGQNTTLPFNLNCRTKLNLDFVFKK